ncbi:MAG: hypothetical protein V8R49_04530 [Duodenibacillus massiliensis]
MTRRFPCSPTTPFTREFPVGVTVASEFDAAGFTVKPLADISFVSTAGDRDTVTHLQGVTHSMRFADTRCWRMAFGVAAQGEREPRPYLPA